MSQRRTWLGGGPLPTAYCELPTRLESPPHDSRRTIEYLAKGSVD